MSSKGIFTALSGAMAQSQRLDTIANNIANSNTAAFKKDRQTFNEYVTAYEKQPDVIQVPRVPASIESFYDMQGGDRAYVDASGTYTDFTQGQLKPTGNIFDMAIEGKGLFEILTPQGVRYTRNGQFKIDGNGTLTTKEGFAVLRDGGAGGDPAQRKITLDGRNITVSYSGDIYVNGNQAGRVSVVEFQSPDSLQKVGSSLFALKANAAEAPGVSPDSQVRQGFVEQSNVNVIDEMTDMISATRTFEATQKAMKAFDQMDEKLVNQVGKA